MGQSSWLKPTVTSVSGLVALEGVVVLLAYGFERFSFEPTTWDFYWRWALAGLAPWAIATIALSVVALAQVDDAGRGAISFTMMVLAATAALLGLTLNWYRLAPSTTEVQKLHSFALSAAITDYRLTTDGSNGYATGSIQWTSTGNPGSLCAGLGRDLTAWADKGSVDHPVGGGPQASSPGVPCEWIASSQGWPVDALVSTSGPTPLLHVTVSPPGTQ